MFLKGEIGDQIYVTVPYGSHNLRKLGLFRLEIFFDLFYKTIKKHSEINYNILNINFRSKLLIKHGLLIKILISLNYN